MTESNQPKPLTAIIEVFRAKIWQGQSHAITPEEATEFFNTIDAQAAEIERLNTELGIARGDALAECQFGHRWFSSENVGDCPACEAIERAETAEREVRELKGKLVDAEGHANLQEVFCEKAERALEQERAKVAVLRELIAEAAAERNWLVSGPEERWEWNGNMLPPTDYFGDALSTPDPQAEKLLDVVRAGESVDALAIPQKFNCKQWLCLGCFEEDRRFMPNEKVDRWCKYHKALNDLAKAVEAYRQGGQG